MSSTHNSVHRFLDTHLEQGRGDAVCARTADRAVTYREMHAMACRAANAFAAAGVVTGAAAELINARFLVTIELFAAVVTGLVIGTAHWAALRVWVGLGERRTG